MFTSLLGANNSELGNIILGFIASVTTISESLSIIQTISSPVIHNRSLSQSLTFIEPTSSTPVHNRSISDSLLLSELGSLVVIHLRSLNESLALVETLSPLFLFNQTQNQSLTFVETVSFSHVNTSSLSQSLVFVETTSFSHVDSRSLSQSLVFVETISVQNGNTVLFNQPLTLIEDVIRHFVHKVTVAQSLVFSETITPHKIYIRHVNQSLTLSSTIIKHPISTVYAVQQSLSFNQIILVNTPYTLLNHFTFVETVSVNSRYSFTITDTLILNDNQNQLIIYDSILGEKYTRLSHIILGHVPYVLAFVDDDLTLTDEINPPHRFFETLILIEGQSNVKEHPYIVNDSIVFGQNVHITSSIPLVFDTLVFHQSASAIKGIYFPRTITQTLSLAQSIHITVEGVQAVHDVLHLFEDVETDSNLFNRTFSESLILVQQLNKTREHDHVTANTIFLTETLTYERLNVRKINDILQLIEHINIAGTFTRQLNDTLIFLDPVPIKINFITTIYVPAVQYILIHAHDVSEVCCTV